MFLLLVNCGEVDETYLKNLAQGLQKILGLPARASEGFQDVKIAYNDARGQYRSSVLLQRISKIEEPGALRVLGVADVDLYAPSLNFIFGEAALGGREGIISLKRLRPEFYGQPADENLFALRMVKEAVHELGHTFGLSHCSKSECVMHFSNSLADTDKKAERFCPRCKDLYENVLKPGRFLEQNQ
ncbi:MAG: hypothetical protein AMS15_03090 [Planctomycetes bacterium DG_23]|nr:MAG: hypothetical protein AMS15_03090 [Planctomycetes bacterium DG_23]